MKYRYRIALFAFAALALFASASTAYAGTSCQAWQVDMAPSGTNGGILLSSSWGPGGTNWSSYGTQLTFAACSAACVTKGNAIGQSLGCSFVRTENEFAYADSPGAGSDNYNDICSYVTPGTPIVSSPYQYTCSGTWCGNPNDPNGSITVNASRNYAASCSYCAANAGTSCTKTSAQNACSQTNTTSGTWQCDGSCSAATPSVPANPANYGNSCTKTSAQNACGQSNTTSGTIQCDGSTCSATTPSVPANPSHYGNACTSSANACGMTNSGTIQCDNVSCSASTPPNSSCPAPAATLSASPSTIDSGSSSTLTYKCTNSSAGSINNGVGAITADGSNHTRSVSPVTTTTYTLTCTGYNGSNPTANVTVTVNPALAASCSVSPTAIYTGNSATWTAAPTGGTGSYTYSWSGTDALSGTTLSVQKSYASSGTKTASVTVNDGLTSVSPACSNSLVVSNTIANLGVSAFSAGSAQAGTPTTFTATLANNGTANTPTFGSTVYLCLTTDNTCLNNPTALTWWGRILAWLFPPAYANTSIKLSSNRISINAGLGGTQTASYTFGAGGNYDMMFCADQPLNEVAESNENDNCTSWIPLTVANAPLAASCSVSPTSGYTGDTFTWTASPTGGTGSYTYVWSGSDGLYGTAQSIPASYGSGGTKSASVTVTSGGSQVSPSCSNTASVTPGPTSLLTATPTSYVTGQGPSTLTWSSTGASTCTGTNFSTGNATSGSVQVNPSSTTSYSVDCSVAGHHAQSSATVTVVNVAVNISANPTTVRSGDSSVISWSTSGSPDSCSTTGPGLSSSATSGSTAVTISGQSTFTIACSSQGATVSKSVTVDIIPYYIEY